MKLSHEDEIRQQITRLFDGMMRHLFQEQGASLRIDILADRPVQDFIDAHAHILDTAFDSVPMSDTMRQSLQHSDYVFSGIKTFHELHEAFPSLLDSNGNRKPFEQFLNDVRAIDTTYNQNYLRAEYNFCQASAQMAANWEQIEADGDRYNLQYRTANDERVREEHRALHGVTLPPSDPFWQTYYPPNGWNCRCTAVQVRKSKYPETPHDEAMQRGIQALAKDKRGIFQFNSGQQRKTFPDYNPYTIQRCRDCNIAKGATVPDGSPEGINLAFTPENELCAACRLIRTGYERIGEKRQEGSGTVTIHRLINRNDRDFNGLNEIATFFAREQGADVIITPKMSRPPKFRYECIYGSLIGTRYEGKCPDLCVGGQWYEYEGFTSKNAKRAFSNMLNHGLKQSSRIIIERPELTDAYMKRNINQRVKEGQIIDEVWIKDKSDIRLFYKKFEE